MPWEGGSSLKDSKLDARLWLSQAGNDLAYAELGAREGFHAQSCFQSQQVCEKALKAIHYGVLGKRFVLGHSLVELAKEIGISGDLLEEMAVLDQYYIPTRYPNGLPGVAPFEVYSRKQAETALATARTVVELAFSKLQEP
jgi:HEPN domain-containing protein